MQVVEHRFCADDLVAGHLALDLANTVTARDTMPRDWLADFAAACEWAQHTGAFLPKDLALLRKQALANPREAGSALRRLRDLRECVHDLVAALAR
ncbi:MAG TPA: ABATE domain-containing protein, partial [Lysobacter sp.]